LTLLWTLAFARRPESRYVAVSATHPGRAWTPGTEALPQEAVPSWRFAWPLLRVAQRWASPERAARSSICLALAPDIAGVSGAYFEGVGRPAAPSAVGIRRTRTGRGVCCRISWSGPRPLSTPRAILAPLYWTPSSQRTTIDWRARRWSEKLWSVATDS
jgi:hypothetical protein